MISFALRDWQTVLAISPSGYASLQSCIYGFLWASIRNSWSLRTLLSYNITMVKMIYEGNISIWFELGKFKINMINHTIITSYFIMQVLLPSSIVISMAISILSPILSDLLFLFFFVFFFVFKFTHLCFCFRLFLLRNLSILLYSFC